MEKIIRAMMDLIAGEVCEKPIDYSQYRFSGEELARLYDLSKSHDLAHLVGDALIKNDLIENHEIQAKFQKQIMLAVYRYEKIRFESDRLRDLFNGNEIRFIPLKGAVIRDCYPEPWMRTSCDIDMLVPAGQVDEVAQLIVERLGYTYRKKNYHDISLLSDSGVHLELHHTIRENKKNIDGLLSDCWSYATAYDRYEYRFDSEFLLFHQFAHAFHHFLDGGCGVRPCLDVFLLERKTRFDRETLDSMLTGAGIKKFSDAISKLGAIWFENDLHSDTTRLIEQFVLSGGVYGNAENSAAVGQQTERGRLGYILHRLWLPYELLCLSYPRLHGRRYLQPFYEVKRWFRVFDPDVRKRKRKALSAIGAVSDEKKSDVNRMLHELGLL